MRISDWSSDVCSSDLTQFTLMENLYGHTFDPPDGPIGYPRVLAEWRRPCRTLDGWITVLAYTDRQWQRFVTEAGRPDLASDPRSRTLADRTRHKTGRAACRGRACQIV